MQELNFDSLEPIEVPVTLGGKKYILREASSSATIAYRNAVTAGLQLGPDGKPSSVKMDAKAEPLALSLCLYETNGDGKRSLVPLHVILDWPGRVTGPLFDKLKEISPNLMLGKDDAAAKNSPSAGTEPSGSPAN